MRKLRAVATCKIVEILRYVKNKTIKTKQQRGDNKMNTYRIYNYKDEDLDYIEVQANSQEEAESIFIKTKGIHQGDFLEFVYGEMDKKSLISRLIGKQAREERIHRAKDLDGLVLASYIQENAKECQNDTRDFFIVDSQKLEQHKKIIEKCLSGAISSRLHIGFFNESELVYIYQVFWNNQLREEWSRKLHEAI